MEQGIGFQTLVNLREGLDEKLRNCGLMFRIFARSKSQSSIKYKIHATPGKYTKDGKKIQDVIGIRLVFYFLADVRIVSDYLANCKGHDKCVDISDSVEDLEKEAKNLKRISTDQVFQPQRLNYVFKMNDYNSKLFLQDLKNILLKEEAELIDDTYEVQFRSVLSEGWHEVEHDLRYKCKNAPMWEYCTEESRALNGIYASLETNERAMDMLFEGIAYKNYQHKEWSDMIRNRFRLRLDAHKGLSDSILDLFNHDNRKAKKILSVRRSELIFNLLEMQFGRNISFPIEINNIVFLANRLLKNESIKEILDLEPIIIKEKLDSMFLNSEINN